MKKDRIKSKMDKAEAIKRRHNFTDGVYLPNSAAYVLGISEPTFKTMLRKGRLDFVVRYDDGTIATCVATLQSYKVLHNVGTVKRAPAYPFTGGYVATDSTGGACIVKKKK